MSGDKRINHKGGSIKRLYERFHKDFNGVQQGIHLMNNDVDFYVSAVNEENRVIKNKVLDVVNTGNKETFEMMDIWGNRIIATADHKFLTLDGYKKLSELAVYDIIFIHNNTHYKNKKGCANRPEKMVKYHPEGHKKKVDKYTYYRVPLSKIHYEASLNGLTVSEFLNILNTVDKKHIKRLNFVKKGLHIHHIDEDFNNNDVSNLIAISPEDHGLLHATKGHNNLRFTVVPSQIVSITPIGMRQTYDIKCAFPYNNYIADKFVVHNSGKTTLALHAIAEVQKLGKGAAIIDVEHALDPEYAKNLGVDTSTLIISQPNTGEQALEICEALVRSGDVGIVVIDSVAALTPKAEIEGEMGDTHIALLARLMSRAMRKLAAVVSKTETILIFINQTRVNVGVMYGNPETTPGGKALKFFASQRIRIARAAVATITDKKVSANVKVVKNKVAAPFKTAVLDIEFGKGLVRETEVFDLGVQFEIIAKRGSWFDIDGEKLGQGKETASATLNANAALYAEVEKKVKEALVN